MTIPRTPAPPPIATRPPGMRDPLVSCTCEVSSWLSSSNRMRRDYPSGSLANLASRCHTADTVDVERTKIVATLGPASSERAVLEAIVDAGVDVVRLNFSHGERADHLTRFALVREVAAERGRNVAILMDLQGPKIRVGLVADDGVRLERGDQCVLVAGTERASPP